MKDRLRGMISCEEALGRLWELVDGELSQEDEAAVRWHLELCSRCYPRYDFQRAYLELMRRIRRGEGPSAALHDRIRGLVPDGGENRPAPEDDPETSEHG